MNLQSIRILKIQLFAVVMILMREFSFLDGVNSFSHAQQESSDSPTNDSNSSMPTKNPPPSRESPSSLANTILKNTRVTVSDYFDSRDYNTMNVLVNSTALPWGFNFFEFSDFHGTENVPTERFELNRFYHEYRLRRPLDDLRFLPIKGLDLEFEINDSNLSKDGVARLAIEYQHPVPFSIKNKAGCSGAFFRGEAMGKVGNSV